MPKETISSGSNTSLLFSTFLHILILFGILSALFILVISKIEEHLFNEEIGKNIQTNMPEALRKSDKDGKLKLLLKEVQLDRIKQLYAGPSEESEVYNTWLKRTMLLIALFILAIIIITGLFLYFTCSKMIPLGHILVENVAIFTFVGIFEGMFFYFIASKYVPVPPSLLIKRLYSDLQDW